MKAKFFLSAIISVILVFGLFRVNFAEAQGASTGLLAQLAQVLRSISEQLVALKEEVLKIEATVITSRTSTLSGTATTSTSTPPTVDYAPIRPAPLPPPGCYPPISCPNPPAGCSYQGGNTCSCGILVCTSTSLPRPQVQAAPAPAAPRASDPQLTAIQKVIYQIREAILELQAKIIQQVTPSNPLTPLPTPSVSFAPLEDFHLAVILSNNNPLAHIFDTNTNQIVSNFVLPHWPDTVAMTGDGKFAYIAIRENAFYPPRVVKLNFSTYTVGAPLNLNLVDTLSDLEISPNNQYLLALESGQGKLHIINALTDTLITTLTLCSACTTFSANGQITFSSDSQFAYVALGTFTTSIPTANQLYAINLSTGVVVGSLPLQTQQVSAIRAIKYAAPYVFVIRHGNNFIRRFNFNLNTFVDIGTPYSYSDLEILNSGNIAVGDNEYGAASSDTLKIIDPVSGNILNQIPTSEASKQLVYDPGRNWIWARCDISGLAFCNPGNIDIIDLNSMATINTVTAAFYDGYSSLSQNKNFYYAMNPSLSAFQILAIDANTFSVNPINVSYPPSGIYMQGDNSTKDVTF